jgi:hypothetical protein
MEIHKLEKDMIFFNPGQSGASFTYKAGNIINDEIVARLQSDLEYDTENEIAWVEERRTKIRPS